MDAVSATVDTGKQCKYCYGVELVTNNTRQDKSAPASAASMYTLLYFECDTLIQHSIEGSMYHLKRSIGP